MGNGGRKDVLARRRLGIAHKKDAVVDVVVVLVFFAVVVLFDVADACNIPRHGARRMAHDPVAMGG